MEHLAVRSCTLSDLDAVMELQEKISAGMEQKDWFVTTSREENVKFFTTPNQVIGIYDHDRLVAYASVGVLGIDQDNYGWECDWPEEQVKRCVNLDTTVVDPEYRGLGLQRLLIRHCFAYAKEAVPNGIMLTTICPDNIYSLRNAQREGFEILLRKRMYGGKDRYLLGKSLEMKFQSSLLQKVM